MRAVQLATPLVFALFLAGGKASATPVEDVIELEPMEIIATYESEGKAILSTTKTVAKSTVKDNIHDVYREHRK